MANPAARIQLMKGMYVKMKEAAVFSPFSAHQMNRMGRKYPANNINQIISFPKIPDYMMP